MHSDKSYQCKESYFKVLSFERIWFLSQSFKNDTEFSLLDYTQEENQGSKIKGG